MIELAFLQFYEQQYRERGYQLYLLKNGLGDTLYIGIATMSIGERWFGWGGHMTWDGKVIYGESPLGVKIENHLPDSLKWKIQLWTLKDCIKFCGAEIPSYISGPTIRDVEPVMIQKLRPALNVTYNLNPGKDTKPKSQKEIELERKADELYRDIFDRDGGD
jgi:hypothetical protein